MPPKTLTVSNGETASAKVGWIDVGAGVGGSVVVRGSTFPIEGGTDANDDNDNADTTDEEPFPCPSHYAAVCVCRRLLPYGEQGSTLSLSIVFFITALDNLLLLLLGSRSSRPGNQQYQVKRDWAFLWVNLKFVW